MRVQDLMSHPAITCRIHDYLDVPARLMWEHDCGVVPVVHDDGKLIGMITDRDICMAGYTQGRPLAEIEVSIAMAPHPISVRPEQELDEVEHMMAEHQVRRLPVVDDDDRPIGVLSLNDIAIESARPTSRIDDACVRFTRTQAAVCAHRTNAPLPERGTDRPRLELVPEWWYETFVEPYPLPAATLEDISADAS